MIAATGWTWEYIAHEMDLPKLAALNDYWQSHPPLHLMVAAFCGFEAAPVAKTPTEQALTELMHLFPQQPNPYGTNH